MRDNIFGLQPNINFLGSIPSVMRYVISVPVRYLYFGGFDFAVCCK